jgi:hypothetical protein
LDRLGNEVEHSFTDPEVYYRPWTQYAMQIRILKKAQRAMRENVLLQV